MDEQRLDEQRLDEQRLNEQRLDDQLEPISNSYVLIQDVALKTYRERWTIETGGGRVRYIRAGSAT